MDGDISPPKEGLLADLWQRFGSCVYWTDEDAPLETNESMIAGVDEVHDAGDSFERTENRPMPADLSTNARASDVAAVQPSALHKVPLGSVL